MNYSNKMIPANDTTSIQQPSQYAIYARASTREQALYGYTIEMQVRKNREYLQLYQSMDVQQCPVYLDDGYSAKNMNRPAIQRLMLDIQNGIIKAVVIYKLDRLTRSVLDVFEFIKFLQEYNCNLISVMDQLDIHSANGRLITGFLTTIAQWERETISERTVDGLIQSAEQGNYPIGGTTPLGYKRQDRRLVIDEDTADTVKRIFYLAAGGRTIKEISIAFQKEGTMYDPRSLKQIIMNRLYIGEFVYRSKLYRTIPPIIDETTFNEANRMITKRFKTKHDTYYHYFKNTIRCTCGEVLNRESAIRPYQNYRYYICPKCRKRVNQTKILEVVLPDLLAHIHAEDQEKTFKHLSAKIKWCNKKIEEFYYKFSNHIIDDEVYILSVKKILQEKKEYEENIKMYHPEYISSWLIMSDRERSHYLLSYIRRVTYDFRCQSIIQISYIKHESSVKNFLTVQK